MFIIKCKNKTLLVLLLLLLYNWCLHNDWLWLCNNDLWLRNLLLDDNGIGTFLSICNVDSSFKSEQVIQVEYGGEAESHTKAQDGKDEQGKVNGEAKLITCVCVGVLILNLTYIIQQ